ncbi:hypothetical protein GBAR_LOCUS22619 [Geodia barretti]|uniref:Uncharacterized protein n=1 Tax=Geodia barretti TaxID=519541 RepID=A0AA35T3P7_GEOBA|nr:hypothetical protein GBAR_LOCUS22619 [Geodia barretti]
MEGKHTEAFQLSEVVRSSQSKTRRQRTCLLDSQWRMRLEFTILLVMIVIVWGLFSLPIVFYYDSSSKSQHASRIDSTTHFKSAKRKTMVKQEQTCRFSNR